LGKLGPEPLDAAFTPAVLADRLSATRRAIKAALLDQHLIAGVGNIYADEALFAANIHPLTPANALSDDQTELLHRAIRHVLRLGIEREGASISNYVKPDGAKGDMQNAVNVFRRTAAPCYACGTPIERIRVTQRSTHFCPRCQPLP
jgi:formamidopyrimidine-DNA glycosylase